MTIAARTQTYSMIAAKLGPAEAHSAVQREVEALLPRYQPQWNQNLAAAYANHFSVEELESLGAEGNRSRFALKLAERQAAIGNDMRSTSEPVIKALVSEALKGSFDKSIK